MRQRHKRFLEWNNERVARRYDFIVTPLLAGLSAIGSGSAVAGAATAIGTAATVAGTASSIAASSRKAPTPATLTQPAADRRVGEAVAQQRRQVQRAASYRSSILSDQLNFYNSAGKSKLGA